MGYFLHQVEDWNLVSFESVTSKVWFSLDYQDSIPFFAHNFTWMQSVLFIVTEIMYAPRLCMREDSIRK